MTSPATFRLSPKTVLDEDDEAVSAASCRLLTGKITEHMPNVNKHFHELGTVSSFIKLKMSISLYYVNVLGD